MRAPRTRVNVKTQSRRERIVARPRAVVVVVVVVVVVAADRTCPNAPAPSVRFNAYAPTRVISCDLRGMSGRRDCAARASE